MSKPNRIPIVTLLIIAINMIAAFGALAMPDMVETYGYTRSHASILTLFTGLFIHQNLFHLAANMVFLAAVGPAVEFAAGAWRFIVVFLVSGLVGVLTHSLLATSSAPLVGASGCIAGCAAYYTIRYLGLRVPIAPNVAIPVAGVTALWVMLQAVGGFVHLGSLSAGTAYWAHLGGFAAGLVLSLTFKAPSMASLKLGHEVLERMNQRGPMASLAAANQILIKHPKDTVALIQKAEAYKAMGDHADEAKTLNNLLESAPLDQLEPVIERLGELNVLGQQSSLKRAQMADRLKGVSPCAATALLASIVDGDKDDVQRPEALLALASLAKEGTCDDADARLATLEKDYPLHPATELARSRGWLK